METTKTVGKAADAVTTAIRSVIQAEIAIASKPDDKKRRAVEVAEAELTRTLKICSVHDCRSEDCNVDPQRG